jgi:hypothetical protein
MSAQASLQGLRGAVEGKKEEIFRVTQKIGKRKR